MAPLAPLPAVVIQELTLILATATTIDDDTRARYLVAIGDPNLSEALRFEIAAVVRREMEEVTREIAEDERQAVAARAARGEAAAEAAPALKEVAERHGRDLRAAAEEGAAEVDGEEKLAYAEIQAEAGQADAEAADAVRASLKAK